MPENQLPATQPEPDEVPAEFNFDKPSTDNPRIKRRSLRAKATGLIKPTSTALPAARELEREAPPLTPEQAQKASAPAELSKDKVTVKTEPAVKPAAAAAAPPRTTPSSPTRTSQPATAANESAKPTTTSVSATSTSATSSPHGTRPATLYYSSYPRKEKEATASMKTTPTATTASSSSASPTASQPAASPRVSAATTVGSPRPSSNIDYRANVERQSREQKSVGNILSYIVYGLIAFFVISTGLAIYGADVIFKRLNDQSQTVSDLDARYSDANKLLNAKLSVTEDTLTQAQSQIARQQELIMKQQEDLNRLLTAINDEGNALKVEKQARAQETASLRARVRDLEDRPNYQQKF